jgi:NADPH:quinone reductase-like Zn-dependent oxidoreductase
MPNAAVLTTYGPPNVLEWTDVAMPEPSERQVLIRVRVSGVGPTDLKIRRGDLKAVFPLPELGVLGFETAGVVDAIGREVSGVAVGDEVAAWLPSLGGYGEYALAAAWTRKPSQVSWNDAGALPASVEAAVGVLRQLRVAEGETLLILGAGGSVGIIAAQLAIRQGLKVIGAVGTRDEALTRELGATPVLYGSDLLSSVREVTDRVDATFDAAGKGGLQDAITLTGRAERVITLADERAAELGVRLSAPTPDRAPDAVEIGMQLLASGELRLRSQQSFPMSAAAEAHRLLEQGRVHHKLLLTSSPESAETAT